jgi:misacylated tRNA(Ala) deacylase
MMALLFREDAYKRTCSAKVTGVTETGGIILDETVFYGTSGGQPGDTGTITLENGLVVPIGGTVTGETKEQIVHLLEAGGPLPKVGEVVQLELNWQRRFKLMQMHTACHLLSVVCPFPITGAAVAEDDSRVDFDLPDPTFTREFVTEALQKLVAENHPVTLQWIEESELDTNPGIVKSKNVRPPRGLGRLRLVVIGENSSVDSQPCGGTHVLNTGEIGLIHIAKIEKKGRENRRFRIRFGAMPEGL